MTEVEKDVHSFKCENCCSRLHMAHLRAPQILLDSHFQLSSLCLPSRSQSGFPGAYIWQGSPLPWPLWGLPGTLRAKPEVFVTDTGPSQPSPHPRLLSRLRSRSQPHWLFAVLWIRQARSCFRVVLQIWNPLIIKPLPRGSKAVPYSLRSLLKYYFLEEFFSDHAV